MDMGKLFNGKIPEKNSRTSGVQTGIPSGETVFFIREPLKGRSFVYGSCSLFYDLPGVSGMDKALQGFNLTKKYRNATLNLIYRPCL